MTAIRLLIATKCTKRTNCCALVITSLLKSDRCRWAFRRPITTANVTRITNATTATLVASRSRIGIRASGCRRRSLSPENVAGSPDRGQQPRLTAGFELAAQIGDEDLDRVGRREGVVAPDLVEQALARDHDALVAQQVLEQLELALGQLDLALAARDLVRIRVEAEIGGPQRCAAPR